MTIPGRQQLSALPDEFANEPAAIVLNREQFESLLEIVEILLDKEFMAQLQEGIRQADAGETISLEELKAELGF